MKAVLVLRSGRLGDFVCGLPAVSLIRKAYSEHMLVYISWTSGIKQMRDLTRRYNKAEIPEWFSLLKPGLIDRVIMLDLDRPWSSMLAARRKLADAAVSSKFLLRYYRESYLGRMKKAALLSMISQRGTRVGWGWRLPNASVVHGNLQVVAAMSSAMEDPRVRSIAANSCELEYGIRRIPDEEVNELLKTRVAVATIQKRVLIYAGGTRAHKKWPIDMFLGVAARLRGNGYTPIFIGDGSDRSDVVADRGNLDLCGRTCLPELVWLMQNSAMLIGHDGGPSHLAASVGLPSVTLFSGIHRPEIWKPSGNRNVSVHADVSCAPCGNELMCPTGTRMCMSNITHEQVWHAVEQLLPSL